MIENTPHMPDEFDKEQKPDEALIDLPSETEIIHACCLAYDTVDQIDDGLCDKTEQKRLRRIRENSLFCIDEALQFLRTTYE